MKIRPLSDLHTEWYRKPIPLLESLPHPEADLLVLAGDIGSVGHLDDLAQVFAFFKARYPEVVYVPGNHEYYGKHHGAVEVRIPDVALQAGVHYLKPGVRVRVADREVVGCALWFRETKVAEHESLITDFHVISDFVPWVYRENKRHIEWLEQSVKEGTIVITHHLPAHASVHPRYAGSDLNRFFVCDMEKLILERNPALWIHGHTHSAFDYTLGTTRIVANPLGYPSRDSAGRLQGHDNDGFNADLVVEVP